jgi:hypothetical protein
MANNHIKLRQMLGHCPDDIENHYKLQTIKDNLALFTPEMMDRINQIAINHGHLLIGNQARKGLNVSCDSFVEETEVHFPTDISLLWDALRKAIYLIMAVCAELDLSQWRQGEHHLRKLKRMFRKIQKLKRSNSKDPEKKAQREHQIKCAYRECLKQANMLVEKIKATLKALEANQSNILGIEVIQQFIEHAERQIDQIDRRAIQGETIKHEEKVFSIFEPHTEWISKGKAGVPVELGIKVCIVKDQFGFILHHHVMEHQTDDQIAVSIMKETKDRFSNIVSCSFDKGFHSKNNQDGLAKIIDTVVLQRKGKLSNESKAIENAPIFKELRKKHSAVESSINALENHGLDRCPDHGIDGFKRYTAFAILARNLQIVGSIEQKKRIRANKRRINAQQKLMIEQPMLAPKIAKA